MIFILTGAGISRESGLETFRDADGLWVNEGWKTWPPPAVSPVTQKKFTISIISAAAS